MFLFWLTVGAIILLVRVSCFAILERTMAVEKPVYREYIEKTNTYFPWMPKKKFMVLVQEFEILVKMR